jgi:predicted ATPase
MRDEVESYDTYPFNLPVVRTLKRLEFDPCITFLVGENGSGKSTLLESIAVAWGFNAEGGGKDWGFTTKESHSALFSYLKLARGISKPKDGYFLRAESFYNLATAADNVSATRFGNKSLHEQSHGESFLSLLMHRFEGKGLYILDEPEAALSPSRQMSMLVRMHDLIKGGSQFIIATHSPILMAYPDALILECSSTGMRRVAYEETENYQLTKQFINNPQRMLRELLREDSGKISDD